MKVYPFERGCQWTSAACQQLLANHQVAHPSVVPASVGINAVAESFFATLKAKFIHRQSWATIAEARTAVFD